MTTFASALRLWLVMSFFAAIVLLGSLLLGGADSTVAASWHALSSATPTPMHTIVWELRLPRSVAAFGVGLLFGAPLADHAGHVALLLALGVVGFSSIASLFAASLGRSRSRDLLLPLIVYPLVVPVLIAGARGTAGLLTGEDPALPAFWTRFLFVFDLIFVSLGVWTFEPLAASEG